MIKIMKLILFALISILTSSNLIFAQEEFSIHIDSLCYHKGYLNYTIVFENHTNKTYQFNASVLNIQTESDYPMEALQNLYKSGASLFYLYDENGEVVNWLGFPQPEYKCKYKRPEKDDFQVTANNRLSVRQTLCLKKYEAGIKKGKKYSIKIKIFQTGDYPDSNTSFFDGTLTSNKGYFSSKRSKRKKNNQ